MEEALKTFEKKLADYKQEKLVSIINRKKILEKQIRTLDNDIEYVEALTAFPDNENSCYVTSTGNSLLRY